LALASLCGAAAALPAYAQQSATQSQAYAIPAGSLREALDALASQANLSIVYAPELVAGRTTRGLSGRFGPMEALRRLLEGSGLTWETVGASAVILKAGPATPPEPRRTPRADAGGNDDGRDDAVVDMEKIIVTGSHIRGLESSASPLLRFDREDIERSGYASLGQFVESLPQNFGGGATQDSIGTEGSVGNEGFGEAANLRGLGPGATLVLLNGRRLAPGGNSGQFIDISMIPVSAIQRIEVLTDGASAIYGADAVGGVINIITREDYEGAETTLRYGNASGSDANERLATQSLATSWSSGNAMLVAEYFRRDPLRAKDRDFAFAADPDTTLLPEQARRSLYGSLSQDISRSVTAFADMLYTQRDSEHEKVITFPEPVRDRQTAANEQFSGSLGMRIDPGGRWSGEIVAGYSDFSFESRLDRAGELTESDVDTDTTSVDARLNGALATLPGGELGAAFGVGYRRENVNTIFDDELPSRNVRVAFGELFFPLVGANNRRPGIEALEFSVAARYENFSDFGSKVTPKYGLRWSPLAGLTLRGTYGKSFKAPTLAQMVGGTESFLAFIPSDFGFDVAGDPLIFARTQSARPDLEAEEATSWTVGFDVQPRGGPFKLSLTYYDIDFTGRIADPVVGGFAEFFNNPEAFGDLIVVDPSPALIESLLGGATSFLDLTGGLFSPENVGLFGDLSLTNIASERQSGLDLAADYRFQNRWGQFDASLHGTYITKFEKVVTPASPATDALNVLFGPVDLRLRAGLTWSRNAWSTSLFANYVDDYRMSLEPDAARIASWTTFDLHLRYGLDGIGAGVWQGASVALSVQNLLDRAPPFVATPSFINSNPGYDPTNADPLGRFVALTVSKAW
jgi:outer membrane receptor protein involved in Fe transport